MARLEYVDPEGAGWKVTIVDGWVDADAIARTVRRMHPQAKDTGASVDYIAEVASEARWRRGYHGRMVEKVGGGFGTFCNLFVLQQEQAVAETGNHEAGYPAALEPDAPEGITYVLQIVKDCPFHTECLENTAGAIGLQSRPYSEIRDIDSYRTAFLHLAERIHDSPQDADSFMEAKQILSRMGYLVGNE